MKKIVLIFSFLLLLSACSKNDADGVRELNITYREAKGLNPLNYEGVSFFPNPFKNEVTAVISGSDGGDIIISDDKGGMKSITFTSKAFHLDFNDEKPGAYYCEVRFNGNVFRTHLIKQQ